MVRCAKCLLTLDCGCAKGDSNGTSALEKKPGAIWVHVTDDAGANIPGLSVNKGFKATNAKGLAIRDPLKPKTYPVELAPLSSTNTDKYDLPGVLKYDVTVQDGTIAHLDCVLYRKATLEAEFVLRSDDKTRFAGSTIKMNTEFLAPWSDAATPSPLVKTAAESDKGLASFGPVSAGKYKLTPDYSALDKREQFDVEEEPQTVDLNPAEVKTAKFHIQQKAQLKVEIICKRPPATKLAKWYLDDATVNIKLEPESGKEEKRDTAKGIADFGWLKPGKYKVTPDYSPLEACKYEWTPETKEVTLQSGDNETLIFEVEPIYQKVQFVAHCLLAIPDQVYEETPQDSDKLKITTGSTGKKEFTYKTKQVPAGKANRDDLNKSLGTFGAAGPPKLYFGTPFNMAPKDPSDLNVKWSIEELEHLWKGICTIEAIVTKPGYYKVIYKDSFKEVPCEPTELSGNWKGKYHGDPVDKVDIDARVSFVKDALTIAHAQTEKDPRILKVFQLPECFFQGLYGAYLFEDTGYLVTELQKAVGGEEWRDWVFGFGTVNTAFPVNVPYKLLPDHDPSSSPTKPEDVLDMNNHAIVIRGGLGEPGPAARMIQKLVNSAELADDLIRDPKATRTQAVNATLQFGDTVNDNQWIKMLTELWRKEESDGSPGVLFISRGLPTGWWKDSASGFHGLFQELKVVLKEWGMARLIRAIRVANSGKLEKPSTSVDSKVPVIEYDKWTFASRESAKSNLTVLPTLQQAVLVVLRKEWDRQEEQAVQNSTQTQQDLFSQEQWLAKDVRRNAVLDELVTTAKGVAVRCGFRLSYQQTQIANEIGRLKGDDPAAKGFVPAELDNISFIPEIFPLWKKLLEFYAESKAQAFKMDVDKFSMSLSDYCFAAPRKAAPWYSKLDEARPVDACKRLVFGLEICADHADQRIKNINTGTAAIEIDIHMVPSAGMKPQYLAARHNGFLINCDGWSTKLEQGGKNIEVHLDGPSPYFYYNEIGSKKPVTPVYPHSAVCKRTETADTSGVAEWFTPITIKAPSADLAKVIFGKGPGEVHIYEPKDLPK